MLKIKSFQFSVSKQERKNSCSRRCSSHGNRPSILEVSVKLERNEDKWENAGNSKAAHKVFQQRGVSFIGEFSLLHNMQFFAWKLRLKIVSSIRCVTVYGLSSMIKEC